jgi:WD40 repeat protein
MLAVARGLALQTTRLSRDEQRELAALLAAQAFRLHQKNGGNPDDAQLFEALRASLARLAPETAGVLRPHQDAVRALALSPSGRLVASGSDDGTVRVFGVGGRDEGSRLAGTLGSEVRALTFVDAGRRLAAGTLDGRLWLIDASADGGHPSSVLAGGAGLVALAHRPNGDLLASAALNGEVRLWPLGQPGTSRVLQPAGGPRITSLAYTTDGTLAGVSGTGGLIVWAQDRPDAAPRHLLATRRLRSVAAGPGGTLAAGTVEGPILVLPRGLDGKPVELSGHTSAVTALGFGAKGERLASSSLDGSVRLWDVRDSEREPIVLSGHSGWVWAVAFSPDGAELVSGGADRTVRTWPTRAIPMLDAICSRVTRNLTPEEWAAYLPTDIPWQPTCNEAGSRSRPR